MKFMDSFLATRSKISTSEPTKDVSGPVHDWTPAAVEVRDDFTGDDRGGGFLSLKAALLGGRNRRVGGIPEVLPAEVSLPKTPETPETPAGGGEPTVEVIRNGERVEKLIVTCSCCRRIELDCSY